MTINLFQMFDGYMQYLWFALSNLLTEETKKISEDAHKIVAIDIIDFVLKSLQPFIEKCQKEETPAKLSKNLIPIVSGLLSSVEILESSSKNLGYALPALDLIELILSKIHYQQNDSLNDSILQLRESVEKFNQFYIKMCENSDQLQLENPFRYSIFKKSSEILCKIQMYVDPSSLENMPLWLSKVIECSSIHNRGSKL